MDGARQSSWFRLVSAIYWPMVAIQNGWDSIDNMGEVQLQHNRPELHDSVYK